MRMLNLSGFIGVLIAVMLCLSGCGETGEAALEPAPADVTAAVMSEVEFASPAPKTLETIGAYYTILDTSSVSEMSVYVCGSGAYPDEIAVIKFNDSEAAEKGFDAISARYDEMVKTFIDYTPDEMYKLDSAVLEKKGNYVIFIVCADNAKAQAAYEKLFG